MSRALDIVLCEFQGFVKLSSSKWRQAQGLDQARRFCLIPQHAEQIDHNIVEIVVDLGIDALFAEQHGASAAERLHVNAVLWKMIEDEGREFPLTAMPAQHRPRRLGKIAF
jgi:hypothetical protein